MGALTYSSEQIQALLDKAQYQSNPNQIDNWYFVGGGSQQCGGKFPINQQGQTSYTASGYTVDRWKMHIDIGEVDVESDGLLLDAASHAITFSQPFENTERFVGQKVTVSVLYTPLTTISDTSITAIYSGLSGTVTNKLPFAGTANMLQYRSLTYTFGSNIINPIWIYIGQGKKVKLHAIKYELSETATLCRNEGTSDRPSWVLNDIPSCFQQELERCQRFYRIYATQSLRPSDALDCNPPMRANPAQGTISIGGTTYYYNDANL